MKHAISLLAIACTTLAFISWAPSLLAEGGGISAKLELRRAFKEADLALAKSRLAKALGLYEWILEQDHTADRRRAEALRAAAKICLADDPQVRDSVRARRHIRELKRLNQGENSSLEQQAALFWLDQAERLEQHSAQLEEQVAEQQSAAQLERQANAAASQTVDSLQKELSELHDQHAALAKQLAGAKRDRAIAEQELESSRAELANKEQALQQIRASLISREGG